MAKKAQHTRVKNEYIENRVDLYIQECNQAKAIALLEALPDINPHFQNTKESMPD